MDRYLITQSLLSSWQYMFDCYESCSESAREDFISTLKREKGETTQAMLDGIAFENAVYAKASGAEVPSCAWDAGIEQVAKELTGAQFQVKVQREITVCGMTFLCYGILDALKAGVISDVKYKTKSFGSLDLAGDYLDSPQHPMYFYLVPEAYKFQYLVSDGTDLYKETYTPDETRSIADIIASFVESIKSMGLLDTYKEHWLAL